MEQHGINPWVRVNLATANPDAEALVPADRREQYAAVMGELAAASVELGETFAAYQAASHRLVEATLARNAFFGDLAVEQGYVIG